MGWVIYGSGFTHDAKELLIGEGKEVRLLGGEACVQRILGLLGMHLVSPVPLD